MSFSPETIGSATHAVQGNPTQIWFPQSLAAKREGHFAIIHDRRDHEDQPGIFFMPGNAQTKLTDNPQSMEIIDEENGPRRRLSIPAALLWDFHGGPCTERGERYRKIGEGVMNKIYDRIIQDGRPSRLTVHRESYVGPFDRVLSPTREDMKKFTPIDPRLVQDQYR